MANKRVAFPGVESGLESPISMHFGHAQQFIVVEYDGESKEIDKVEVVKNPPHQQGGCMMPVMLLKENNVDEIILGGIGGRPLMGFQQVGIKTYRGMQGTIKDNFDQFVSEGLPELNMPSCNHN